MRLEKIITVAHARHRLRFVLMERSLRAVGCDLPLLVIPFDQDIFELPKNSSWWEVPEIIDWVKSENLFNKRKYQVLTTSAYQFVDTDICFLRNPETVLEPHNGLVVCCNEWMRDGRTVTKESAEIMKRESTMYRRQVFCAGQFACDRQLYTPTELIALASKPDHVSTCMHPPYGDQEAINLLVFLSGVEVTNLTMPPYCMESSWAGDYPAETAPYWDSPDRKPYLMHYWGCLHLMHEDRPVNYLFRELLTREEQGQWVEESKVWAENRRKYEYQRAIVLKHRDKSRRTLVDRFRRTVRALLPNRPVKYW